MLNAKQKYREKQFYNAHTHTHTHTTENPSNLSVDHRQAPAAAFAATNMDQKCYLCGKEGHFQ